MFRSLLIPIDLGSASERVVGRAALLPFEDGARFTLLHVVPKRLPSGAIQRAKSDAQKALAKAAARALAASGGRLVVQTVVRTGIAATEIAEHARSIKAELIVMGRGGGRTIRDVILGSTAARVIRQGRLPVLVVRLPSRSPYTRPAVAVDPGRGAHGILAMLLRLIPARSRVLVIHAYDVPYHGFIYPGLSAEEAEKYEEENRQRALRNIAGLLRTALTDAVVPAKDAPLWKVSVRHGSPRMAIERAVKKANVDLLAMGTHAYTGMAHAFLGSVAGDVLRKVPCDVLVVPPL